jgi:hypothetical protein
MAPGAAQPTQSSHNPCRKNRHAGRSNRAPNKPGRTENQLRLKDQLPKAGLWYPLDRFLLKRYRRDFVLTGALRKDTHFLSPQVLNQRFSQMFDVATELLAQQIPTNPSSATNPIPFLLSLRKHESLQPWARAVSKSLFISLFLVLRAARANWHRNPREPFDIGKHCQLARAIDAFDRVDPFAWHSAVPLLGWAVCGGLQFHDGSRSHDQAKVDEEDEEDSQGAAGEGISCGDGGSDEDGLFVKRSCFVSMDEDMEDMGVRAALKKDTDNVAGDEARRHFQLSYEQVVEGMRLLNIDVDETALTEAFAKLRIYEESQPASGRRRGNPFLDDSDDEEDVVL